MTFPVLSNSRHCSHNFSSFQIETLYLRHSSSLFRFNLVPCDVYSTFRVCEFPYSKFHISKIIQQLSFGSGLFHLELVYRSRPRHIINQNFISFYSRRIVHHMDILRFIYPFICWPATSFWLFWIVLLWTLAYTCLFEFLFLMFLGTYPGGELPGALVILFNTFPWWSQRGDHFLHFSSHSVPEPCSHSIFFCIHLTPFPPTRQSQALISAQGGAKCRSAWVDTWTLDHGKGKVPPDSVTRQQEAMERACGLNVVQSLSHIQLFATPLTAALPGSSVLRHFLEFAQIHIHWVGDAIQPSQPLSPPSPLAFSLSQHQDLFKWVDSSHQVAKVLKFQLQSFQWISRVDFL